MRSLKITITLLTLVTLGIVVGSNLSELMAVVVLSQPTVALPIGLWLIIAIGLGLLSSSAIQLLLFLQRRSLNKKVRQLQQRLQEQDEDIFTYRSAAPEDLAETEVPNPQIKRNRFSFRRRREPVKSEPIFTSPRSTSPIEDDVNDWEDEPRSNRQLDWDDVPQPTPQPPSAQPVDYSNPRPVESRFTSTREPELARTDEVYDADFRLIQPPYKQAQPESEYSEYEEDEDELEYDEEEFEPPATVREPKFTDRSNRQTNRLDDEDWGFDFDEEESRNSKSKPQRI
jgi:hypothetical protein